MRKILVCASAALSAGPFIASAQTCPGLVGWWSFEGDAADRSGLGNHGAVFGDPAFVPGVAGRALLLDGIDDFVEVADSPSLNPAGAVSISAWWWSTAFSGSGSDPIVDKGAACHCPPYYQYQLGVSGSQYTYPSSFSFIAAANGAPGGAGTDLHFYSVGRWYHIVGVYDGAEARMYVDGSLVSAHPVSGPITSYGRPVRFGRFNNLPQFYLPGAIDEVRIYDRGLSDDEAALLHERPAGEPIVRPALVTTCPGAEATFRVVHLGAADAVPLESLRVRGELVHDARQECAPTEVHFEVRGLDLGVDGVAVGGGRLSLARLSLGHLTDGAVTMRGFRPTAARATARDVSLRKGRWLRA